MPPVTRSCKNKVESRGSAVKNTLKASTTKRKQLATKSTRFCPPVVAAAVRAAEPTAHCTTGSAAAGLDNSSNVTQPKATKPKVFWRTIATARPSTGGPNSDPAAAKKKAQDWKARQKAAGIVNGRAYGYWSGPGYRGWVRVDPKTKKEVPPKVSR